MNEISVIPESFDKYVYWTSSNGVKIDRTK